MSAGFDARRYKALERAGFNRIAARYAEGARLRRGFDEALLAAAELRPGERVLDLASGPGVLAHAALASVAPHGRVLATDIAERMLTQARANTPSDTLLCAAADAEQLCLGDASVDVALAGLALFMFPHPERALAELHRVLVPGGRLALSVWSTRDAVPLIALAQDSIARVLPPPKVARPSVFRFGDPATLGGLLSDCGFTAITIRSARIESHFANAQACWQGFLDLAGGVTEALAKLPDDLHARLQQAMHDGLAPYRDALGRGYTLPASVLVASARRP
ncbi:MAG: class I SAM-dependent methyltransferase [Rhodocyclaceae bacterium]